MNLIEKYVRSLESRPARTERQKQKDGNYISNLKSSIRLDQVDIDVCDSETDVCVGGASSSSADHTSEQLSFSNSEVQVKVSETNIAPLRSLECDNVSHRKIVLSLEKYKSRGLITPDNPRSQVAEEYRSIKRQLLAKMKDYDPADNSSNNVIMVTSCVAGEGKTFSALNLAMSIATERDKTVLLIDADVMKASASALLGFTGNELGLTDILMDDSLDISDVIWPTNVEKLRCVPAGSMSDHASELLGSNVMLKLITELSSRYSDRIIIFDSPPLLLTSEAMVLAGLVDQIALVVAAETTKQGQVIDALSRLTGDAHVGLILNKSRKKMGTYYGYGYGTERLGTTTEGRVSVA